MVWMSAPASSKCVAQAVDCALLGNACALLGRIIQALHAVLADRVGTIARAGKQPQLGTVGYPVAAQLSEQTRRQQRIAIFAAFALLYADIHARGVSPPE